MCDCPPGTRPSEYTNQVVLELPSHVRKYMDNSPCRSSGPTVAVDRCLVGELQDLWSRGITTTGCCCGHNEWRHMSYIGVLFEHIPAMKALGYEVRPNKMRPGDEDSFVPKSV